jgi:head-tail adaptor
VRGINPGKLRHALTLQTPRGNVGADGVYVENWALYKQCLGLVTTPSVEQFRSASREVGDGQRTSRRNSWLVTIRHDKDVSSAMRILWLDHVFEIDGITADVQNASYMICHCYEIVPASQGFGLIAGNPQVKIYHGGAIAPSNSGLALGTAYGPDGETTDFVFTLENDGAGAATITTPITLTTSDSELSIAVEPDASVAAGGSTSFTLRCTADKAHSPRTLTGTIVVNSDDPVNAAYTIPVTLTLARALEATDATGGIFASGSSYSLGLLQSGPGDEYVNVTLSNRSSQAILIAVSLSNVSGAWSLTAPLPTMVAAGGVASFRVELSLGIAGAKSVRVKITGTGPEDVDDPYWFNLAATVQ